MSQRKLALLGYPVETIDCENPEQLHELVQYLEDQHIRIYKIEQRTELRSPEIEVWKKALAKYLKDLGCPLSLDGDSPREVVDWLLSYAINLSYVQIEKAKDLTSAKYEELKAENEKLQKANDPLNAIDFTTEEARKGIDQLRTLLGIAAHPDPLVVLRACCKFITNNLSNDAIQKANKEAGVVKKTMPLNRFDMGMASSKNATIDAAVRTLRLIHLENLREVQTEINEAIVAVQELTADPKTDKRLGKVGF